MHFKPLLPLLSYFTAAAAQVPPYYLRMWDKPRWQGVLLQKNYQYGQCVNWDPAVGAYVMSAVTETLGVTCKVYGSNDYCSGEGHTFDSMLENSEKEGLPTFWRSWVLYPTFPEAPPNDDDDDEDGAQGEVGGKLADLTILDTNLSRGVGQTGADDNTLARSVDLGDGEVGEKVQPGSAGWSVSAGCTAAPGAALAIAIVATMVTFRIVPGVL